jgi:hypothetical protein
MVKTVGKARTCGETRVAVLAQAKNLTHRLPGARNFSRGLGS